MVSTHARCLRSCFFALLGAAAVAGVPCSALAAGTSYSTLAEFQLNVRGDFMLEPFNGPDATGIIPFLIGANGYALTVSTTTGDNLRRSVYGIGASNEFPTMRFTSSGRPIMAFGGTLRIINSSSTPVSGSVMVSTDTGESFTVNVSATGTFFGFTTTQPWTFLFVTTVPATGAGFEFIDDAYFGTPIGSLVSANQCADASTISPTAAASYPFTTVGATATTIQNVCDSAIDTGPDVWFRFVATSTGSVTAGTCGSDFDTILRVFATCPNAFGDGSVACNDDFCTGGGSGFSRASQVTFRVVAGEDYYIRISGYNGASGSGNLSFSVVPDCRADYNRSGSLEVQDIFDFLNGWFAGCP
jgi:hypothetical protein